MSKNKDFEKIQKDKDFEKIQEGTNREDQAGEGEGTD